MYLLAGGYFDYVAGSSVVNDGNSTAISFNTGSDKTDFGFRGVFGIVFPRNDNKAAFGLEVGYDKGLNNIQFYNPAIPATQNSPYTISNTGLTISITAQF